MVGAVAITAAIVVLRADVEPSAPPVVGPDGKRIAAYHDPKRVTLGARSDVEPSAPADLRTEARRRQVLVSWAAAPTGFEVRWARTDGPGTPGERYVTTPATTLTGLDPGRYRIEVRSVDDSGRRSGASTAEVVVGDERPEWERGLGFLVDFTDESDRAELDADRWRGILEAAQCVHREGPAGPLLLSGNCIDGALVPTSSLVLSDPDPAGVRGRLVVVADAPGGGDSRDPSVPSVPGIPGIPGGGGTQELIITVGAARAAPGDTVRLALRDGGAYLSAGQDPAVSVEPPTRLDLPVVTGPGVVHRWELVFTADEVRVLQNGHQVGAAAFRPAWRETDVAVTIFSGRPDEFGEGTSTAGVELVGLTGPAPDSRPTEVLRLSPGRFDSGGPDSSFTFRASPDAEEGRLTGTVFAGSPGERAARAPRITVEVGGRVVEVRTAVDAGRVGSGYAFEADVPADLLRAGGTIQVRTVDGTGVALYRVELEVTHRTGSRVDATPMRTVEPADPAMARPRLTVTRDGAPVTSAKPVRPGSFEVEVSVPAVTRKAPAGWVAIRVELDGRAILVQPTGADGPAVTCSGLRFTLHVDDVQDSYQRLEVVLVPALSGVTPTKTQFTLRLQR